MPEINTKATHNALFAISRTLVDYRTFQLSEIDKHGTITMTGNGRATGFSETAYFSHSDMSFGTRDTVTVVLEGTFFLPPEPPLDPETGEPQEQTKIRACLWNLTGLSNLYLSCASDHISIYRNSIEVLRLNNLELIDNTNIITTTQISAGRVTLEVVIDRRVYSITATNDSINVSEYTGINIGTIQENSPYYWDGVISMSTLRILKGHSIYYSPTTETTIDFDSVIVATDNVELTDSTHSIVGEAYELPILEVKSNNNNICIYTEINEDQYLTINQIGIYCIIDGIRRLFSVSSGLKIKKTEDLPYELVIHLYLDINIVNVDIRPLIEVKNSGNVTMAELNQVKYVLAYDIVDMERAIKANAKELGFNRAQIFYKLAGKLRTSSDTWTGMNRLTKFRKTIPSATLENYYVFPYTPLYSYNILDVATESNSNTLAVSDKLFSGPNPLSFNTGNHSLVLYTNLVNLNNKEILVALDDSNSEPEIYFSLVLNNSHLIFTYYTTEDVATIDIHISPNVSFKYLNPTLFTITSGLSSGNINFKIYNESTLIGETSIAASALIDPSSYKLQNYITIPEPETPTDFPNESFINENAIVTPTIMHLSSILTEANLKYLTTLFGI